MLTSLSRRCIPTSSRTVRYAVTTPCVCRCFSSLSLSRFRPPLASSKNSSCPLAHLHPSSSPSFFFPTRSFATTNDPNVASKEGNRAKFAFTMEGVTKKLAGGRTLFSNINLAFLDGAKIGILGSNGSGKSSLLRIIAGVDPDYDGTSYAHPGFKIGYLAQEPILDPSKTVAENVLEGIQHKQQLLTRYDEIAQEFANPDADMDALATEQSTLQAQIDHLNCWDLQHKVEIAMDALRCPPGHLPVTNLSGGEKRRVALCRLLLSEPDVLLLDEPTNHLDAMSVAWLEQYLDQYRGLVIAITHDRYFLDKVAGYILEIAEGYLYPFKGNYATWLEAKAKRQEITKKRNAAQDKMMERELAWLRQNSSGQRTKSKARIRSFEQLEEERSARKANKKIEGGAMLIPEGPRLGQLVIQAQNLSLKHPDEDEFLFENVSFQLQRGHIMGVIGPNGSGKSTLLKLLVGERQAAGGTLKIGETVIFGYNSQTREQLNPDNMIWQEICGTQEFVQITNDYTMLSRAYVAQFNFSGTEQQKRIKNLSGGERNRVHLAKSLAKGCNVILLDEPTNDLDVDTLRSLEEALVDFEGAAIVVSHDRWFLDRVCTDILSFEEDGSVMYVEGNFTEYERTKRSRGGDMTPKKAKFKKLVA